LELSINKFVHGSDSKKISTGCEAKPRGKRSSENDLQLKKPFQTI
jgi:hypothetical protein